MGGELREIANEVEANAEKAGREIKMMLDAAKAGDWTELRDVEMSTKDVQYLNDEQKDMIAETRSLFDQAKTEGGIEDDQVSEIEKVLSGFEDALNNQE